MSILSKLIIAIATAAIISQSYALSISETIPHFKLFGIFCLATVLTIIFGSFRPRKRSGNSTHAQNLTSDKRSKGIVKWFNSSKGFGFITVENGEEVFVHFKSIRGTGRRVLRDGQQVTLRVADNDKGPQAEDVEII